MRTTRSSSMKNRLLDSGEFGKLNDPQAMYYMRRLWSVLPEKIRGCCVYIDPAWMFKFRTQLSERNGVIEWFGRFDIFLKKYVFFPLCISNHWTLVVLCNPGGNIKIKKERPSMILLDSLEGLFKNEVEVTMSSLLHMLYEGRFSSTNDFAKIKLVIPKVPTQTNDTTCGFYVLFYMTLFLKEFPDIFDSTAGYPACLNKDWFTLEEFDSFHSSLKDIFNRIDDYTSPNLMSDSLGGLNNDQNTIDVIRSCLQYKGEKKINMSINQCKKRKKYDSPDSGGIVECVVVSNNKNEGIETENSKKFFLKDPKTYFYCGSFPFLVFFYLDRASDKNLLEKYEYPRYKNWMDCSLRKVEMFLLKSESLSEGGLNTLSANTEDFNSWKYEDEEKRNEEYQNEEHMNMTYYPKNEITTEEKQTSDEDGEVLKNTVEELEESLNTFEKWSDNFIERLKELSSKFKEEECVVALKDKFVDLNNAANWVAETVFDNTIGSMYVERLNAVSRERRRKDNKTT
ncbi:hypothetical protein POM88_008948 [Heracleum sosnowskyi]|uniref:Ubiquitin-like protease family profile domain-containing protein n=1 Tax=Heracleum sosnowskyi TaxID=360622 RepID=A0AAD8JAS7_9APIA|nr:hypothetical protein POM88_008948 [Heracleum sosnowskyi]